MSDLSIPLVQEALACTHCAQDLPHEPKPIIQIGPKARVLIISQAPGARAHASGIPWDDASGDQFRSWLGVDRVTFYDHNAFGILPMGFCFPGRGRSGDLPPLPACAPLWHPALLALMPHIKLTLVVGRYAQQRYLPVSGKTLTETVRDWRAFLPEVFPLPHPSPRNRPWQKKHPWFAEDVLPELRNAVYGALGTGKPKA